jgi:hypothetical protein
VEFSGVQYWNDAALATRNLYSRDIGMQMAGLQRLSHALPEHLDTILQELVNATVDLCGADSAGISIEKEDSDQESYPLTRNRVCTRRIPKPIIAW